MQVAASPGWTGTGRGLGPASWGGCRNLGKRRDCSGLPAGRGASSFLDYTDRMPIPPECLWPVGLSYYPDQVLPCPVFFVSLCLVLCNQAIKSTKGPGLA